MNPSRPLPALLPAALAACLFAAPAVHAQTAAALAAGLALSFTVIGLFVATIGFSLGLDLGVFRMFAGIVLLALGLAMLVPAAGARLATAAGPLSDWTQARFGAMLAFGIGAGLPLAALGALLAPDLPVYVSVDIDALDPAVAPATPAPEPGAAGARAAPGDGR